MCCKPFATGSKKCPPEKACRLSWAKGLGAAEDNLANDCHSFENSLMLDTIDVQAHRRANGLIYMDLQAIGHSAAP